MCIAFFHKFYLILNSDEWYLLRRPTTFCTIDIVSRPDILKRYVSILLPYAGCFNSQLVIDIDIASRSDNRLKRYVSLHPPHAVCFTSQLVKDIDIASGPDNHPKRYGSIHYSMLDVLRVS